MSLWNPEVQGVFSGFREFFFFLHQPCGFFSSLGILWRYKWQRGLCTDFDLQTSKKYTLQVFVTDPKFWQAREPMLHPNPGRLILVLHPHLTRSRNTFNMISASWSLLFVQSQVTCHMHSPWLCVWKWANLQLTLLSSCTPKNPQSRWRVAKDFINRASSNMGNHQGALEHIICSRSWAKIVLMALVLLTQDGKINPYFTCIALQH